MKISNETLKLSILGLLSIKPMTGYELLKNFRRSLYAFWPVPLTQIYPMLKTMESEKLIIGKIILQEKKPNKNEYRLTNKGEKMLLKWLNVPSKLKSMKHEFMHKLFLYNLLPLKDVTKLVQQYKRDNQKLLNHYLEIRERFRPSLSSNYSESVRFQLLSLDHLINLTKVEIESVEAIEAELDKIDENNLEEKRFACDDLIF